MRVLTLTGDEDETEAEAKRNSGAVIVSQAQAEHSRRRQRVIDAVISRPFDDERTRRSGREGEGRGLSRSCDGCERGKAEESMTGPH
jgi:hypothetical protein